VDRRGVPPGVGVHPHDGPPHPNVRALPLLDEGRPRPRLSR
jgi:hypothetical protein